jgi:hypothetical protein
MIKAIALAMAAKFTFTSTCIVNRVFISIPRPTARRRPLEDYDFRSGEQLTSATRITGPSSPRRRGSVGNRGEFLAARSDQVCRPW